MQQTEHKLKPRSFHKSAHFRVHSTDFHPGVNHAWQIGELLLLVYKRFCSDSQTIARYGEEGLEVGLDREAEEGVQRVKEEIYKRTGVSSTRLR